MAPHFVRLCQLVRRILVRWMAGSTPATEEISATSAAGRVVIRTQVRMLSRIDAQHLWIPCAASRVRIRHDLLIYRLL